MILTPKWLQKNLKTIRGFTKSTDLVIRTKKLIKKSHETVPLKWVGSLTYLFLIELTMIKYDFLADCTPSDCPVWERQIVGDSV